MEPDLQEETQQEKEQREIRLNAAAAKIAIDPPSDDDAE